MIFVGPNKSHCFGPTPIGGPIMSQYIKNKNTNNTASHNRPLIVVGPGASAQVRCVWLCLVCVCGVCVCVCLTYIRGKVFPISYQTKVELNAADGRYDHIRTLTHIHYEAIFTYTDSHKRKYMHTHGSVLRTDKQTGRQADM